jgi:hypothetical protein
MKVKAIYICITWGSPNDDLYNLIIILYYIIIIYIIKNLFLTELFSQFLLSFVKLVKTLKLFIFKVLWFLYLHTYLLGL